MAAVERGDLARLLTREHGKVYWEALFDAGTMGAMATGFAPMAADALTGRVHQSGVDHGWSGCPMEWWRPSCRSTGRSR